MHLTHHRSVRCCTIRTCALTSSYEHPSLSPVILPLSDRPLLLFLLRLDNRLCFDRRRKRSWMGTSNEHTRQRTSNALVLLGRVGSTEGREFYGYVHRNRNAETRCVEHAPCDVLGRLGGTVNYIATSPYVQDFGQFALNESEERCFDTRRRLRLPGIRHCAQVGIEADGPDTKRDPKLTLLLPGELGIFFGPQARSCATGESCARSGQNVVCENKQTAFTSELSRRTKVFRCE